MALTCLFILSNCHSKRSLREIVGSQVVRVTTEDGTSGGTGVHVISPNSGKVYLLTNKHICREAKDGILWVGFDKGRSIPRHVIEMSKNSDACLMEPLPDMDGIQLSSEELKEGQEVSIWGHPLLQPLSEAKGKFIAEHDISVLQFIIDSEEAKARCNGSNESTSKMTMFIFEVDVCLSHSRSDLADALIFPGNSGSSMVSLDGKLVGLVFASSSRTNWSESVPLSEIREFLLPY